MNTAICSSIFNDFTVHKLDERISFLHINLTENPGLLFRELFDYFFDESRILRYIENKVNLNFSPTDKDYVTLFKHLSLYIDDFNMEKLPDSFEDEVLQVLAEEYGFESDKKGGLKIRLDKIGKIGEYIFCNLLSEYFGFNCIIPKINLITDKNMSIFGIDALYYSKENDMILFGESKFSKNLGNGVQLINKSLEKYEEQIESEFSLVLSGRLWRNNPSIFGEKYEDVIDKSLRIHDFIKKADIKKIGVPLFIAHGICTDINDILKKLNNIKKKKILNLETIYIIISLPILDKNKMMAFFALKIRERIDYYERKISE